MQLLRVLAGRTVAQLVRWRTLYFFERDLAKPPPEFHARIPVEVRVADPDDFERLRDAHLEAGVDWKKVQQWRERGDLCFIGLAEGRLAHFMWLTREPLKLMAIGVTAPIGPREGFVGPSYTDPALRGLAIQPAVANFMIKHERGLGLERHYFYVVAGNEAGRKIVTGRHAPSTAQATRVLTCIHVPLLRGALLRGLDGPGRPRLEVAPGPRRRQLGRFGVWISGWPVDPGAV